MSSEKYSRGEAESQVRSIIKQLNDERPAKEKSREVVVRPDGTKVVRVIKKRKVTISSAEKNRHAKKRFFLLLLILLLLGGALAVSVSVRMSSMAGDSYIQKRQEELCRAWGATSVHCTGAGISGFSMQVESLVAEFPESSVLKRVEMRNIKASLATTSFFSGVPESDELKIDNAVVVLREGVKKFAMPLQEGKDLWKFKRVNCAKLSFYVGDEASSPVSLKQAEAYMYNPAAGKNSRVLIMSNGLLQLRGWKPIVISDAKMLFTDSAVDDIHLTGTLDVDKKEKDTASTLVALSGNVRNDDELAGPFSFESVNIGFSELSAGKFMQFFNGTTTRERGQRTLSAYVRLPFDEQAPVFSGSFRLKDVRITSFPAMMAITGHLEPTRRKGYLPPVITEATVELLQNGDVSTLRIADGGAVERELISIRADVSIDSSNKLSGTMEYGIPAKLTHVEYADGLADPVFKDDGVYAWFATQVSGFANAPMDNSAEVEANAAVSRAERSARIPFDEIDVDDFSSKMKAMEETTPSAKPANTETSGSTPAQQPESAQEPSLKDLQPQTPSSGYDISKLPSDSSLNNGNNADGGGLSLPTDGNFFPGLYH